VIIPAGDPLRSPADSSPWWSMAFTKPLNEYTKAEQFFSGIAIGTGIFFAFRFGTPVMVRIFSKTIPKFLATKTGELIVQDLAIGRVLIVQPGTQVTIRAIASGTFATLWYIMGGMSSVKDYGRHVVGVGTSPAERTLGDDEYNPINELPWWIVSSTSGQIQYATINGARVDP